MRGRSEALPSQFYPLCKAVGVSPVVCACWINGGRGPVKLRRSLEILFVVTDGKR